jgi:hypothetical protein
LVFVQENKPMHRLHLPRNAVMYYTGCLKFHTYVQSLRSLLKFGHCPAMKAASLLLCKGVAVHKLQASAGRHSITSQPAGFQPPTLLSLPASLSVTQPAQAASSIHSIVRHI